MLVGCRAAHADAEHAVVDGRVVHGLRGVAREVEQHLLDHGAVAQHGRQAGLHGRVHAHAQLARLQAHERQDGVQQLLRGDGLARLVAAAHEVVHALDDLARALGLARDVLHGHAHVLQVPRLRGFEQIDGARGIAGDGGQGLVELVAQQRGHLAHGGEARRGL